jgi:Na+-transporting NADH:ubiquinone oxidoreductase subunit NqrB
VTSQFVSSPYVAPANSLRRLMLQVIVALVPGTLTYAWQFGPGVLVNIALACLFALMFEAAILKLRARPVMAHLGDYSAIVAAWLFALCLPMHSPWWLVLVGIGFTMIAGKHVYGGLGFNPFNPAMVGYVVLLISFPREMTTWYLPGSVSGDTLTFGNTTGPGQDRYRPTDRNQRDSPVAPVRTLRRQRLGMDQPGVVRRRPVAAGDAHDPLAYTRGIAVRCHVDGDAVLPG